MPKYAARELRGPSEQPADAHALHNHGRTMTQSKRGVRECPYSKIVLQVVGQRFLVEFQKLSVEQLRMVRNPGRASERLTVCFHQQQQDLEAAECGTSAYGCRVLEQAVFTGSELGLNHKATSHRLTGSHRCRRRSRERRCCPCPHRLRRCCCPVSYTHLTLPTICSV